MGDPHQQVRRRRAEAFGADEQRRSALAIDLRDHGAQRHALEPDRLVRREAASLGHRLALSVHHRLPLVIQETDDAGLDELDLEGVTGVDRVRRESACLLLEDAERDRPAEAGCRVPRSLRFSSQASWQGVG